MFYRVTCSNLLLLLALIFNQCTVKAQITPGTTGVIFQESITVLTCTVCAEWNPAKQKSGTTITGSGLTANIPPTVSPLEGGTGLANVGKSTGKWYWEIRWTTGNPVFMYVGIALFGAPVNTYLGNNSSSWGFYSNNGSADDAGASPVTWGSSWAVGDYIGIALDMDNGAVYFRKNNGTWFAGGDPTSGSLKIGAAPFTGLITASTVVYPAWGSADGNSSSSVCTANFGTAPFHNTPPPGYNYGIF